MGLFRRRRPKDRVSANPTPHPKVVRPEDQKIISKAFSPELNRIRLPEKQIKSVENKLAACKREGISMDDLKIVVHNLTSKEDFRNDFLKSDIRTIVKNIRSNASFR